MSPMVIKIVAVVILLVAIVVTALLTKTISIKRYQESENQKLNNAEDKARQIIDEAVKTAETKKREALLEAKEEAIKNKNEIERESKERRAEIQRYEKRVLSKEEALDKKSEALEKKESKLNAKDADLDRLKKELETIKNSHLRELEKISGLTSEQAKEYLLKSVEEDVKHDPQHIAESQSQHNPLPFCLPLPLPALPFLLSFSQCHVSHRLQLFSKDILLLVRR